MPRVLQVGIEICMIDVRLLYFFGAYMRARALHYMKSPSSQKPNMLELWLVSHYVDASGATSWYRNFYDRCKTSILFWDIYARARRITHFWDLL